VRAKLGRTIVRGYILLASLHDLDVVVRRVEVIIPQRFTDDGAIVIDEHALVGEVMIVGDDVIEHDSLHCGAILVRYTQVTYEYQLRARRYADQLPHMNTI